MNKSRWLVFFLLLTLWLGHAPGAASATPPKKDAKAGQGEFPLRITAARLEADQKEGIIIFTGKVKADYGDSTLYADQLRVYFKPKAEAPKSQAVAPTAPAAPATAAAPPAENQGPLGDLGGEKIDRIVARGQVRFVQEDRVATGEQAVYTQDKDEVVLTGNPQLWRAENTLKGERIIFNIKTNRVQVESSPQKRVEAVLYSQTPAGGKGPKGIGPLAPKARKEASP